MWDNVIACFLAMVNSFLVFTGYQAPAAQGKSLPVLHSKAAQSKITAAFDLPVFNLENARPLLKNPDRGLRMETYMTLGETLQSYPGNHQDPCERLLEMIEKYAEDSPTLTQLYVYLSRYNERPLDDLAFSQLQRMLELCRAQGIRVLLRFTYQNESNPDPDWPRVQSHLKQIGAWFKANAQLVDDTVMVMQAGLVGYWGEGHSYVNFKEKHIGKAFNLLLRITPADIQVHVREMRLYHAVSKVYKDRLGMHDDYIIGEKNGAWSFFLGQENKTTERLEKQFKRTVNDAELPWGRAAYYDRQDGHPLDSMEAMPILQQLNQYALSSLSLEHNYREAGPDRLFTMARWKNEYLTALQLEEAGLPYHPGLLDEDGRISAFAYIQYHLGYLLSITAFELDEANRQLRFTLQNNGLAAPLNFAALSLVIGGEEYLVKSYDRYRLGSMQAVTYTVDLPEGFDASQSIGVKLARRAGSAICVRFANTAAFVHGAQMMYSLEKNTSK